MARHFLLEYISLRNFRKTGSGSVDGPILRGKPGFTVEVGGEGRVREDLVELYLRGTNNVLRYLKILKGDPDSPPEQKIMRRVFRLISNRGGIFLPQKESADPHTEKGKNRRGNGPFR
jgi:predicted deacylase